MLETILGIIFGVASGGTTGAIVKGVVVVLVMCVYMYFKNLINKLKIEAARKATEEQKQKDQTRDSSRVHDENDELKGVDE